MQTDTAKNSSLSTAFSWWRKQAKHSKIFTFLYQLYYQLRWLPKQLRAVYNGDNLIRITNQLGVFFARPLTSTISQTSPAHQPTVQQWMQKAPAGIFIDLGAGPGLFTTVALKSGSATKVYSFEPNPAEYPLLVKHIADNNPKAEPVHAALAKNSGSMEMPPNTVHTQSSSVCGGSGVQVPTIAFDQFTAENDIDPNEISCIKISSYGHEISALEGMQKTLHELPTDARVIVEITETGKPAEKTIAFVKWCGYELADHAGKNHLFVKQ